MSVSNESFSTVSGAMPIDVYSPASSGKRPAVLIFHGTLELKPPYGADIVSFAEALNKKGVAAAIPFYFKSTKTTAGDEALNSIFTNLPAWKRVCGGALAFMAADARFDATRLGLLGFSLGGHIALNLAMQRPAGTNIKAVVDFFAPTLEPPLHGNWSALPPVLIHHGTADPLSIDNSKHVVRKLAEVGRAVTPLTFGKPPQGVANEDQFIEYPGEKHGFTAAALSASRDATIQFLDRHLK
jgi:dienelactone hydrolase